ncbi:MAG: hypothetical protein HYY17_09390, partial [Planctomycetes bacterium]|nr:hypothetical protein [Planctomycetota bacterium]
CLKAMEKDRGHRYASAQEFADDIARVRRGEAIQARPPSFFYRLGKRLARRKALTIVSAAAIVVAGTLATVAVVSQRKARVSREQALTQLRKRTQMALEAALGFRRAGRLEEMRRYGAETEEACREAIRDFPDRPEPHHELGRMYRALMRDGDALAEQEAALRLDPRYAPALYERVVLLARRYRRLLAELIARAWREEGRLDEPSRRALGSKDPEMQALRARLAEDLRFLDSEAARGLQAWVKGETAAARESLSAAVKKPGAPEEAFEALATLEAEQGRYDESVRVWSRAIDADLGYLPHLEGRAGAYIEWGRSSGSREHFEKAVEDYATALGREPRITAWIGRGRARTEWAVRMENPAGLHQAAVEDFGEALKADPAAEEAWTGRGLARLNWGAFQQDRREDPSALYQLAVQDFGKALERNPDRDGTWSLRGLTHLYWGDWKKEPAAPYEAAIRDFDEAIRRSPVREWTWRYRAHARRKLGLVLEDQAKDPVERYEGAIADYGEALRRDASRGESWVMRGRTRVDLALWISGQGRDPEPLFRDAVGDFTGAMKFDPAARGLRADALATWALHRMEHGNDPSDQFRGAIGDYSAILDQTPADADAFARRGRAYEEWGRWTKRPEEYRAALRDYEAAVERDPKRADSLRKSIDFCRRMAQ